MPTLISFLMFVFVVVQQPSGYYSYVSNDLATVTQYQSGFGIRLMAHAEMAGSAFSRLRIGDEIKLDKKTFIVADIWKYRTMFADGTNPPADTIAFMGADGIGITGFELYNRLNIRDALILQTCFDGVKGRLFVIAYPETIMDKRTDTK